MTACSRNGSKEGIALVAVLVLVLVLTVMGLAFISTVRTQTMVTMGRMDALRAEYLAESAANHALWRLLNEADSSVSVYVSQNRDDGYQSGEDSVLYNSKLEFGKRWYVGTRFLNVSIPQGEAINFASVQFMASDSDSEATSLTIYGHDTDNARAFVDDEEDEFSGRGRTSASVAWQGVGEWEKDVLYDTPDLVPIIQEIVDRPGWASGNALVLLFKSNDLSGERRAYARDDGAHPAPLLTVGYGDQSLPMTAHSYTMHDVASGRYGYKVRRPGPSTFATIASVGLAGDAMSQQSRVVRIKLERRVIDISNTGDGLSDYEVPLVLSTDKMGSPYVGVNEDGSDIRFLSKQGAQLNYWIESWDSFGDSKVWIRVPSIPAGDSIIYMTHGDPDSLSQANGHETFMFYDDFEDHADGDMADGWFPATYGIKKEDGNMVMDDKDEIHGEAVRAAHSDWADVAVAQRFKCKSSELDQACLILRFRGDDDMVVGGVSRVDGDRTPIARIYIADGGGPWDKIGGNWAIPDVRSGWHVQELAISGGDIYYWLDGKLEGTTTLPIGGPADGLTGFWTQDGEKAYHDWHRVRSYRNPEPTAELR